MRGGGAQGDVAGDVHGEGIIQGGLLLGGMSRRMGQPKGLMPLPDGRPMAAPCLRALAEVSGGVCLLGGPLPDALGAGLPILRDLRPGVGPLGGVEAALKSGRGAGWILLPWDMPGVGPGDLAPLVAALRAGAHAAVYRRPGGSEEAKAGGDDARGDDAEDWKGGIFPLPMALSAEVAPALQDYLEGGGRAIWRFLQGIGAKRLAPPGGDAARFKGINTPEALAKLRGPWDDEGR